MKIPLKHANKYLNKNLNDIPNVKAWAEAMGRSRTDFSRQFKSAYGITPTQKMAATRKVKLDEMLFTDPTCPAEILAGEVGLKSPKSLCGYIKRHYHTTLTDLRKEAMEKNWKVYLKRNNRTKQGEKAQNRVKPHI